MSIENIEIDEVMEILENLEDEQLAVIKLKEFNDATKVLGELLMNLDKDLGHDEWKVRCDHAKKDVERIVDEIKEI